ncbi:MAG: Calx-beta domain-containing protein [Acidimicrobiales bacterium]
MIDDDPAPTITPGLAVMAEGDSGSRVVEVPVSLSNPSATTVTVDWATIDTGAPGIATQGVDYSAAVGTVTFLPGETGKTVTIEVIGDTLDEPPAYLGEWVLISFANPSTNATLDLRFFGLGIGIIIDDD